MRSSRAKGFGGRCLSFSLSLTPFLLPLSLCFLNSYSLCPSTLPPCLPPFPVCLLCNAPQSNLPMKFLLLISSERSGQTIKRSCSNLRHARSIMPKSKQAEGGEGVEQQGKTLKPSKLFINCAKLASNQQEVEQGGGGRSRRREGSDGEG